jgi:hypothetical protein
MFLKNFYIFISNKITQIIIVAVVFHFLLICLFFLIFDIPVLQAHGPAISFPVSFITDIESAKNFNENTRLKTRIKDSSIEVSMFDFKIVPVGKSNQVDIQFQLKISAICYASFSSQRLICFKTNRKLLVQCCNNMINRKIRNGNFRWSVSCGDVLSPINASLHNFAFDVTNPPQIHQTPPLVPP